MCSLCSRSHVFFLFYFQPWISAQQIRPPVAARDLAYLPRLFGGPPPVCLGHRAHSNLAVCRLISCWVPSACRLTAGSQSLQQENFRDPKYQRRVPTE
ncbi:hypothetical protein F5Y10DRAFT_72873 [Nemania abortiva]|nr:hypothetical protein F5Y10DRAFT_72873 [Nemania abortiva]